VSKTGIRLIEDIKARKKYCSTPFFFFFVCVGVDEVDQFSWIGRTFGFEESTNYFVRSYCLRLISDTLPTGGAFGLIEKIRSNRTNKCSDKLVFGQICFRTRTKQNNNLIKLRNTISSIWYYL
jgi:hypothetical protein